MDTGKGKKLENPAGAEMFWTIHYAGFKRRAGSIPSLDQFELFLIIFKQTGLPLLH